MWKRLKRKNADKSLHELKKSYEDWDISPDFSSWDKIADKLSRESMEEKASADVPALEGEHDLSEIKQGYSSWEPEFDEQKIWADIHDSVTFEKIWNEVSESLSRTRKSRTLRPLFVALTAFFVLISFFVNESALFKQASPGLKAAVQPEKAAATLSDEKITPDQMVPQEQKNDTLPGPLLTANEPVTAEGPLALGQNENEIDGLLADEQAETAENIAYLKFLPFNLSQPQHSILYAQQISVQKLKSRIGLFVSSDLISINQRDNINRLGSGVSAGLYYSNFKNRIPYSLDLGFSVSSNKFSSYYNGEFINGKLSMTSLCLGLNLYKKVTPKINVLGGINLSQVNNLMQERNGVLTDVNAHNPALIGFNAGIEKKIAGNLKTRISYNAAFPMQKSPDLLTIHQFRLGLTF
ncbi:MAG: outer membrane protein [Bacteroidota bacterium]